MKLRTAAALLALCLITSLGCSSNDDNLTSPITTQEATATSEPEAEATISPETTKPEEPAPTATPQPTAVPMQAPEIIDRQNCTEISGTSYRSEDERRWFQSNCVSQQVPVGEPPAEQPLPQACHSSYQGACLDPNASDYDCAGGSGNGPLYTGPVTVVGPDKFDLDRDGDGYGCE